MKRAFKPFTPMLMTKSEFHTTPLTIAISESKEKACFWYAERSNSLTLVKINNLSRMKHFFLFATLILTSLLFLSCEKIDNELTGSWQLKETYYLIRPNEDFTFYNVFGDPWQGEISINGAPFNASSFTYYFDNSWPTTQLTSNETTIRFFGPELDIEYLAERYVMNSYIFDIQAGLFKAEGTATGIFNAEGKTIEVKIDLTMPKMELKQGQQVRVKDGYLNMPYHKLWLRSNGKMDTDYLRGDIMEQISGRWSADNGKVTLSPNKVGNSVYCYAIDGNTLQFSRKEESDDSLPLNLSPYRDKVEKIIFCADYIRQ